MSRSSQVQKVTRLNAAYRLLAQGMSLTEAATTLARDGGISRRQAYRYLEQARQFKRPIEVVEPTLPVTFKIPAAAQVCHRSQSDDERGRDARDRGLGAAWPPTWLSDDANEKSVWSMHSIVCSLSSFSKRTSFSSLIASASSARRRH
jgi:hypothetical protein